MSTGRLRVRIEQFSPALGDPEANAATIAAARADAAAEAVSLLVTPELSLTGYDLRDRVHPLARPLPSLPPAGLGDGPDVIVGAIERGDDFVPYNVALHLRGREVLHRHRKVYLPTYGMFDEGRYFGAGDRVRAYDLGDGWRVGLLVCEDLWHPSLPYLLALDGAHLIVVLAASAGRDVGDPTAGSGRYASWPTWVTIAAAAAHAYGVYVAVANRVGVEGGVTFAGGSFVVDPFGAVVVRGDDGGSDRPTAELSLEHVARARQPFSHARDEDPRLVAREISRILAERA